MCFPHRCARVRMAILQLRRARRRREAEERSLYARTSDDVHLAWLQCTTYFFIFIFCLLPPARASLPAALARSCEPCHSELAERAAVIGGVPVEERCCAGGRGTQRDSHSAPKRRLDDVCAPKRQRGTDIESVFAHGWLRSSAAFTR